ncbi:unnamed protein product [Cylicocyclus nassatus]|uniref:CUB domain-containing protein n=1 Tax=Cylicocyclus nassatus TaxID=53992 RepID=A0AA36GLN7_CYLNA|nr:unnamed protein product [Cylicocyclus nassatus]
MLILCILPLIVDSAYSADDGCGSIRGEGVPSLHSFTSPNYPNHYSSNLDCVRVIQARPGFDILVNFHHHFQIETSYDIEKNVEEKGVTSNCPNDFIEFRDGRYGFSPVIGRFCGMDTPKMEIRARSGFLWIRFRSDDLLEYTGFYATYEMVRSTDRRLNPHGSFYKDCEIQYRHALDGVIETKTLTSGLPHNYTGPLDCVWLIEVPSEYSIVLYFDEFSLYFPNHCGHNFFEVFSGTTSDQPARRYCGMTAAPVFSAHHIMYIRFYLDDANRISNTSISALYSSYAKLKNCSSKQMFSCGDDNCVPQSLACNGRKNCPYGNDELACHVAQDFLFRMVFNSYSPLVFLTIIVFLVVCGLYIWHYWPRDACRRRKPMQTT